MAKVPKGKEFEKVPEGNHPSVCVGVYDLGTQTVKYKDKTYDAHQIRIMQQCVELRTEEGENMCIHGDYTFSDKSKNLAKIIKSWTGQDIADLDPATLLLRPGLTNVVHTTTNENKTYANIAAITMPPKGMKITKATEPASSFFFEFEYDDEDNAIPESVTFNEEDFKAVPDWIKKKIVQSKEYPIALANNENGGWEGAKKGKGKAAKTATKTPAKTAKKK
jgi:hypothetical protein